MELKTLMLNRENKTTEPHPFSTYRLVKEEMMHPYVDSLMPLRYKQTSDTIRG